MIINHDDIPLDSASMIIHRALLMLSENYKNVDSTLMLSCGSRIDRSSTVARCNNECEEKSRRRNVSHLISLLDKTILQGELSHASCVFMNQISASGSGDRNAVEPFEIAQERIRNPLLSPLHPLMMNGGQLPENDISADIDDVSSYKSTTREADERRKVNLGTSSFAKKFICHL
mmetsp:Transcript_9632/g.14598  ORF Transcript_9632/g.14598 Transcript_9632/m.14598 type:complete len:175 (-) Transcript_9632:75-599(-)